MSLQALALVVAGALLHATWNYYAKKASGHGGLPFVWLFGLVSLVVGLPFGLAVFGVDARELTRIAAAAIAASAVVHIAYSLILQEGYRRSDFSLVYPVARGTGPLFAVAGAVILLGEVPGLLGGLGIVAVLLGVFLISGLAQVKEQPHLLTGVSWGSLTGTCIAAYTLIDAWAVTSLGLNPLLYYSFALALRSAILAPAALRHPRALRDQWQRNARYILIVGLLSPLAYTLVLFAMTMAPVAYVAPVRELSMMVGVLYGARLLREAVSPLRLAGMGCMIAGVVMLALA